MKVNLEVDDDNDEMDVWFLLYPVKQEDKILIKEKDYFTVLGSANGRSERGKRFIL
jgi:hypothetical protein